MSSTINLQNVLSNIIRPIYVYDPATSNYVVKVILSNVETYSGNSFNVGSLTFGDANYNLYIGSNAGSLDPFSSNNVAIGYGAAEDDSNVQNSVFIGYLAGGANILDASATVAIGSETLAGGSSNVYIGYGTGSASSNSSGNVFLGPMIAPGGTVSNQVRIGSGSTVPIFANLATGRVGINTTTPGYDLDVAGATANIQGDLQVAGTLTATNFAPTTLKVRGVSSTLNAVQVSAIEVGEGDSAIGPFGYSSISFQYSGGGFRHLLRTRHNNALNNTGNAVDFFVNNSTTATGSTQPNSGNKLALAITGGGVGVGGILLPSYDLDVSGTTRTSNAIVSGFLRDALTPVTLDISGGNISNSGTTQSSNFIGNASASNSIGGITLSNGTLIASNIIGGTGTTSFSNIIVPGYIRDALTPSTLDISGGNISNSGTTRSSNFIGTTTASNSIGGVILSNSNAIVSGFLRNALTPTTLDISGGNISNSGSNTTNTLITRNLYPAFTSSDASAISYISMGQGSNGAGGGPNPNNQFLWLRGGGAPYRYAGINYGAFNTNSFLTYATTSALNTKYIAGLPSNQTEIDACLNLLTLTTAGRLGLSTNSPATTLDVTGATRILRDGSSSLTSYGLNNNTDTLILQHTGNYSTAADLGKSASILFANAVSNYPQARIVSEMTSVTPGGFSANLLFQTNNSGTTLAERMRIHSNGNVGIGTNSPATTLDVSGILSMSTGTVSAPAYTFTTDASLGLYRIGANQLGVASAGLARMSISNANVGIATTAPVTRFQVNPKVIDDSLAVYDTSAVMIVHPLPTGTSTLNDPQPILYLGRQGASAQAYGAMATFKMSRYENSSVNSRTRMDITMAHDAFLTNETSVMTMRSDGRVGIGTTAPTRALDVSGTAQFQQKNASVLVTDPSGAFVELLTLFDTYGSVRANGAVDVFQSGTARAVAGSTTAKNRLSADSGASWLTGSSVGIGTTAPAQTLDVSGILQVSRGAGALFDVTPSGNYAGLTMNGYFAMYSPGTTNKAASNLAAFIAPEAGSSNFFRFNNTGFGTTAPAYTLDISAGNTTSTMRLTAQQVPNILLQGNGTDASFGALVFDARAASTRFIMRADGGVPLVFETPINTERMRVTPAGNVGIGTAAPAYRLDVTADATSNAAVNMSTWPRQSVSNVLIARGVVGWVGNTINWSNTALNTINSNLMTVVLSNATNGCSFKVLKSGIWSFSAQGWMSPNSSIWMWLDVSTSEVASNAIFTNSNFVITAGQGAGTITNFSWTGYLPSNTSNIYKIRSSASPVTSTVGNSNAFSHLQIAFLNETPASASTFPF